MSRAGSDLLAGHADHTVLAVGFSGLEHINHPTLRFALAEAIRDRLGGDVTNNTPLHQYWAATSLAGRADKAVLAFRHASRDEGAIAPPPPADTDTAEVREELFDLQDITATAVPRPPRALPESLHARLFGTRSTS